MPEPEQNSRPHSEHDRLYLSGSKLIRPHLRLANRPETALSNAARAEVVAGLELLRSALQLRPRHPNNWATYWLIGKAHEALGQFEESYRCFQLAFSENGRQVDVARELCRACIETKRFAEAVLLARRARDIAPRDPGIIANLALALLLNGEKCEALTTARVAHGLDPSDRKTNSLLKHIENSQDDSFNC